MFWRIILCAIISETILVASSDTGLFQTVSLKNNNTPAIHLEGNNFVEDPSAPINFNNVSQSNNKEDGGTDDSFQKAENDQQTAVFKKTQNLLDESSSTNEKQSQNKENNDILTTEHLTPCPQWIESLLELMSEEVENVQLTTEPQESVILINENEKQTTALNKVATNVEKKKSKWRIGSSTINVERKQPTEEQYVIGNANLPNSKRKNLQPSTENQLLRETDSINPKTRKHALKAIKVNTELTPESEFQNFDLLVLDSIKNKMFEDEHEQLLDKLEKDKQQSKATILESAEVDDDRSKGLRQRVENWYGNLQTRRAIFKLGVSPELRNVMRFRRNLQSALAALSQKRLLSEMQKSHAVNNRKQSKWRRQLLSQYSAPQAVDYRRLLSLWENELRRQLKIKWNRRPLVEISPGAFKSDIHVNPPDDLAKHMQKLLALKKRQEDRNRDVNAGRNEEGQ